MAKNYIGKAPLTMARTTEGGYVYVYEGAPVPANTDADDLKRLVDEGFLEEDKDAPAPAPAPEKSDKIDDILAEVGDDKEKAAAALEAEKAGKNRSTLVTKLEAIISPDQA